MKKHTKKFEARKMMTHQEVRDGIHPFLSVAWLKRRDARKLKQLNQGK